MNICENCGSKNYHQSEGYCRDCFCQPLNHVCFSETNNFDQYNDYINFKTEPNTSHSKIYRLHKILDTVSQKNDIIFPSHFYENINIFLLQFSEYFFFQKERKNFPSYSQIINYFAKNRNYGEYAKYFPKCKTEKIRIENHIMLRDFEKYIKTI